MWHIDIFRVRWEQTLFAFPTFDDAWYTADLMLVYLPNDTVRVVFVCGES